MAAAATVAATVAAVVVWLWFELGLLQPDCRVALVNRRSYES